VGRPIGSKTLTNNLELLWQAVASDNGIAVIVEDFEAVRQRLYKAKASDPAFADLAFRKAPDGMLWIVKTSKLAPILEALDEERIVSAEGTVLEV